MNHRILVRALSLAALAAIALPQQAEAGGGFGSVWAGTVIDSSISFDWSDPSGQLRHASSLPKYEICYKPAGAWFGSCNQGDVIYTSQKPYVLTGLSADQAYKIKVFTYTEKKNWLGKWKNPEYRKVGTLTQSTMKSTSVAHQGNLTFLGGTAASITVRTSWSHPTDFDFLRACYKKTWSLAALTSTCRKLDGPKDSWSQSTAERGWLDVQPALPVVTFEFGGLSSCR